MANRSGCSAEYPLSWHGSNSARFQLNSGIGGFSFRGAPEGVGLVFGTVNRSEPGNGAGNGLRWAQKAVVMDWRISLSFGTTRGIVCHEVSHVGALGATGFNYFARIPFASPAVDSSCRVRKVLRQEKYPRPPANAKVR